VKPLSEEFEYAKFYFGQGLTVIPLRHRSKTPLVDSWTTLSPDELFNQLSSTRNINLGIRLDGLVVLDLEDAKIWDLFFTTSPQEIAKRTWVSRTGGGGYHVFMRGETKPFRVDGFAELRSGRGQYVVAPPSIHPETNQRYEWLSDVRQIEIAPLTPEAETRLRFKLENLRKYSSLINSLIKVWIPEHRHNLALSLAGVFRKLSLPKDEAELVVKAVCLLSSDGELNDRLRALEDTFNKPKENVIAWSGLKEEITSISHEVWDELIRIFPLIDEKDSEKTKKKLRYMTGGEVVDGKLIEVVEGPALLIWDGVSLEVKPEFETENEILKPYPHLPFALPRPPEIREDPSLWNETKAFIREYYDNPRDEKIYDVLTAAVAWSYFVHDVNVSTPYLCFLGPWRSGKTRALEVLSALCHKPMFVVDPSEASVFRMIETFKPTLLVDESQIVDSNVRALFAAGYRYGVKIPRVVDPEADGVDGIRFFDCFGLKIYASREQPPDDIFSRSIIIHCERNIRSTSKRIDEARALELRTRWFAQHLRMFGKIRVTYEEFQSDDGRLQELISPLIVMAETFGGPSAKQAVEAYGRLVEAEIASMESDTPEADIVQALVDITTERGDDAPEIIAVSEIVDKLNDGDPDGEWTPERVGRRMTALGFKKHRDRKQRGYVIDYGLLERLIRRYRIKADLSLEGLPVRR